MNFVRIAEEIAVGLAVSVPLTFGTELLLFRALNYSSVNTLEPLLLLALAFLPSVFIGSILGLRKAKIFGVTVIVASLISILWIANAWVFGYFGGF